MLLLLLLPLLFCCTIESLRLELNTSCNLLKFSDSGLNLVEF
ncbi:hypothetical protein GLYMA_14G191950v4 [Glycine max]|nr:hypothetical protein GLYMA_14G191950v4 [Glycine max]KAH1095288.1 hypothetical protein GYH30_040536 [Glycine max]